LPWLLGAQINGRWKIFENPTRVRARSTISAGRSGGGSGGGTPRVVRYNIYHAHTLANAKARCTPRSR